MMFPVDLPQMLDQLKSLNADGKELKWELERLKLLLNYVQVEDSNGVSEIVKEIRKVCFEIEDVIETYAADASSGGILTRVNCIGDFFGRRKLESELSVFKDQIHDLNERLELCCVEKTPYDYYLDDKESTGKSKPTPAYKINCDFDFEYDYVGIEENKKIAESLFQFGYKEFPVIAICGMGGMGKTTLARKVFMDKGVRRQFDAFAWVTVSQEFQMKPLLQDILLQFNPSSGEEVMRSMDLELAQNVYKNLKTRKCLVVVDDLWEENAWNNLKICFPDVKSSSRIVITTRNEDLAKRIADKGVSFQMKTLSADDSWQLFLKKQSSDFKANQDLEEIGKNVVKKCGGLPLAIVVVAGMLARTQTSTHWKSVLKKLNSYPFREPSSLEFSSIPKALRLSYEYLPYHLQNCLLYCSLFPKDVDIEADKLIKLWVAEGFISSDNGEDETTMSDKAERCLYELVMRNLIFVQTEDVTRVKKVKCRVHDLLREMCLLKGKEDNILEVLDLKRGNFKRMDSYPSLAKSRRLSVYLNEDEPCYDIPFKQMASRKVRSLLFRQGLLWPHSFSLRNSRLLRVLDFDAIGFEGTKLPEGIENLVHLKYLSFKNCYNLKELPSSIGNLSNLLTLDLRVCGGSQMTLPNVFWKLKHLRHLYLPSSYQVHPDDKLRLDSHRLLETLENFDSSHCYSKDLLKLYNLRYLLAATEGSLEDLEVIIKCMNVALDNLQESSLDLRNFDCYSAKRNSAFEKVLAIPTLHTLHMDGHLGRLPELITPSLTEIFFGACEFTEDPMARLEKLPKLHKLVLRNGAFIGKQMVCSASGFQCLKRLKLLNLQKLERWTIEEGALPKLSALTVEGCKRLDALPDGLIHLSSLQKLEVLMMPQTFTDRHQKEGKDFYKIQHIPEINFDSHRCFFGLPDGRIRLEKS